MGNMFNEKLVGGEMEKLKSRLQGIQADMDKYRLEDESVRVWLQKLRDVIYDAQDVLDDWCAPIGSLEKSNSVSFFSCFSLNPRARLIRDVVLKMRDINRRLDAIAAENSITNTKTTDVLTTCWDGRDEDKNTLIRQLLQGGGEPLGIFCVVGMGGIGKTTLAQQVYRSEEVITHFERRIWVCVSDPFDQLTVAKSILEHVQGTAPHVVELQTALGHVNNTVAGTKFLLVLDDVCTDDYTKWEPLFNSLRNDSPGSKILVTSRTERVSKMMGTAYTLSLRQLSARDSWTLFSHIAFSHRTTCADYEDIGRKITTKCHGLPLAIATLGSLMRFKNTVKDWQRVLDSKFWKFDQRPERGLLPPLLLTYYDLPPAIKMCFTYCAAFPKDCKIEADSLIKIWMALGYLTTTGKSSEMESTGQVYLQNLVMRSLFQDLSKDQDADNVITFKMHDLIHDFAQSLADNESFVTDADSTMHCRLGSIRKKIRHLTLIRGVEAPFPVPPAANTERLTTFRVHSSHYVPKINSPPAGLFFRMPHVKVLDLSHNSLSELPNEAGRLTSLRYLDLSHNSFCQLPETVSNLFNLQTLKLFRCKLLKKLPLGMEKLINLRHLEIDGCQSLTALPKGVGRLSTLRTLSNFLMGSGEDATEESTCNLRDLGNLNHLRGCLKIQGLGDAGEAEKAPLLNKKHLVSLQLDFYPLVSVEGITDVIEALQPHPNLQTLQIQLYGGTQLPDWMVSLPSLRKLRFQGCQNFTCLPPLGKLPSLETLCIESMPNLKYISHEFLGVEIVKSPIIAFPKLKMLKIAYMANLEQWDVISTDGGVQEGMIGGIMPRLHYLDLSHCYKLKTLPDPLLQLASLEELRIQNCPILQRRYQNREGDDWTKISHIPKARISSKRIEFVNL